MISNATLINTGEFGHPVDVFRSVNAKFREVSKRKFKNMDVQLLDHSLTYTFDADINTAIAYASSEVSIIIDDDIHTVGVPGNLFDLVDLLNALDYGWFTLNDAKNAIVVYGFWEFGDIIQDGLVVFSAGASTAGTNRSVQADMNREFAIKIKRINQQLANLDQWVLGGNTLTAKGFIGSINNQPVSIIVDNEEVLSFRVNTSFHRMGKLFSMEYSDNNTSWGSGAMTDWEDGENNTGLGADALAGITSGDDNTAVGKNSLHKIIASNRNTATGYNSGSDLELGSSNFFGGRNSGNNLINGNANTFIGSDTKTALDGIHSSIALGYNAELSASNQLVIGSVPDGDGYGAITQSLTYYTSSKVHSEFYRETLPNAGSGTMAGRGSTYWVNDGATGSGWLKVGATNTGWEQIQTTTALAIPNQEVVFGNGTTIVSSTNLKFNTSNNRFTVNGEIYAGLSTGLTTDSVMKLSNSVATSFVYLSTATPESVITASRGSICLVNTGSLGEFYLKTSTAGNTGWSALLSTSTGALMALSNLASVSINASLIPQTTKDLGAAGTAWRDLYLYGSGTFGSHSIRLTGTPTSNRVLTLPDVTDTLVGLAATQTLTNKRITKRSGTVTSSATPTINTDNVDIFTITALAVDITSFTTNLSGTPTEGQLLWIAITGTATRNLTWGASFENGAATLPTATVSTTRLDVTLVWNTVTSKWRCMAAG